MPPLILLFLRVFFSAEATASAYGYIRHLIADEATMIGSWAVSADIIEVWYVFAFSFGVLATIALSWHWISRIPFIAKRLHFKSASFGVLYSEIAERRDELNSVM